VALVDIGATKAQRLLMAIRFAMGGSAIVYSNITRLKLVSQAHGQRLALSKTKSIPEVISGSQSQKTLMDGQSFERGRLHKFLAPDKALKRNGAQLRAAYSSPAAGENAAGADGLRPQLSYATLDSRRRI